MTARRRRRVARALAASTVAVAWASACTVPPLDLEGKRCPCATGFVCDTSRDLCVTTLEVDAGPPDAAEPPPRDSGVAFRVFGLRPGWATANTVRWDWQVTGAPETFERYELVVGRTAEAVRAGVVDGGTTVVYGPKERVELGSFGGRAPSTASPPFAHWTVSDGHKALETVFAQVRAFDREGRVTTSDVASQTTVSVRAEAVLFGDALPEGASPAPAGPDGTRVSTKNAFGGAACLARTPACDAGGCGALVGATDLPTAVNALDATDFAHAFVELAVRGDGAASPFPRFDFVLTNGAGACGRTCELRLAGSSLPAVGSEWRVYQLPLRFLRTNDGAGAAFTFANLSSRNARIHGFKVVGDFTSGVEVAVDQVRLRW